MPDTIFGDDPSPATPSQENPAATTDVTTPETPLITPTIPPELAELVGEGKKYKTIEEAQRAIPHAQSHISTLEADNARMKEELTKRKTTEELLADIRNSSQTPEPTAQGVEVNKDVVSEIVKQQLAINTQETLQRDNTTLVVDTFINTYGADKAKEEFAKVAANNGMTVSQMEALVATTPKAVLNLAGITTKTTTPSSAITSNVNTQSNLVTNPNVPSSKVTDYGKSVDVADAMRRAKEIVTQRLQT